MLTANIKGLRCFYNGAYSILLRSSSSSPQTISASPVRLRHLRFSSQSDPASNEAVNSISESDNKAAREEKPEDKWRKAAAISGGWNPREIAKDDDVRDEIPASDETDNSIAEGLTETISTNGIAKDDDDAREEKPEDQWREAAAISGGWNPREIGEDDAREEKSDDKWRKGVAKTGGGGWTPREIVVNKKKGKMKTSWVCESCGHSDGQWWGTCRSCNKAGTLKRFSEGSSESRGSKGSSGGGGYSGTSQGSTGLSWLPEQGVTQPLKLTSVIDGITKQQWRISLPGFFGNEVGRVLGGGLAPGSLILVGGDPGIGKSTLLLQIAAMIAEGNDSDQPAPVLYVSGEESVEQIGNRADRMKIETDELYLFSSSDLEDILTKAHRLAPRALIVDSIQTVYLKEVTGSAGGLTQVKECTSALLRYAKKSNVPVFLVGHVTKAGDIAGPRVLEHIVDVVLYMEGEEHSTYRLLRSVKNRFGSTDELGIFQMSESGLEVVSNPTGIYLSQQNVDSDVLAGIAVAVVMDGSRSFLIEVQALCSTGSTVGRHVTGVPASRADMIIAVLMKQAGLRIQENGIYLNAVNGVTLSETAGDLAIAAAICSSFLESPIPQGVAFIGEVGLGGEVRTVPRMEKRVSTVAKLGFTKCVVPKSTEKTLKALVDLNEIEIIGCKDLKDMINAMFTAY